MANVKVDSDNEKMEENHKLRKRIEELEAKVDNKPQAGSEL